MKREDKIKNSWNRVRIVIIVQILVLLWAFSVVGVQAVTLDPQEGGPGTQVTATGTGSAPSSGNTITIRVSMDGTELGQMPVDSNGNFKITFVIPSSAGVGKHDIYFEQQITGGGMGTFWIVPFTITLATVSPTPTIIPTKTAIPTNQTLTVDKVWTIDENDKDKTSFAPGDSIRFGVTIKNDDISTAKGVFTLQVTGPKNIVQMAETPKDFAPGLTTFGIGYDPGIIPKDAPSGTYTLTVTVTYNGLSSSKQSQFTVIQQPTQPTPEQTPIITPVQTTPANPNPTSTQIPKPTVTSIPTATPTPTITLGTVPYVYVTNANSDNVSVIDTENNNVVANISVGDFPIGIAVNPAGTKVYVANDEIGTISIIDTTTNNVTTIDIEDYPVDVAINRAGTKVYVTNSIPPTSGLFPSFRRSTVSVIDTSNDTVVASINVGENRVWDAEYVAINPMGTKAYVTNFGSGTVDVIDTAYNSVIATVKVGDNPYGVVVDPTGTKVYVANAGSNNVSVIDTVTNKVIVTVNVGASPRGVAINPVGTKVYVANADNNNVSVIDTITNKVIATIDVGNMPWGVVVDHDGTKAYVTNSESGTVSVIDTVKNSVIATVKVGSYPWSIAMASTTTSVPTVIPTVFITANPDTHDTTIGTSFTFAANPSGSWGNNIQYNWNIINDKTNSKCPGDWTGTGKSISASAACTGTHNVSVTVSDEKGNVASSSYLMTVTVEKVELLIVPTNYSLDGKDYGVTSSNKDDLPDIADEVKKFFLKSSYGSIGMNFSIYPDTITLTKHSSHDDIVTDTIRQIAIAKPEYLVSNKYQIIAIAGELINQPEGQAFPTSWYKTSFSIVSVPSVVHNSRVLGDYRAGAWEHEIGHILDGKTLIDLYGHGDVYFWDLMGLGSYVFDNENNLINKPTDISSVNKVKLGFLKRNEVGYGNYLVNSLENMNLNDPVLIYKTPSISGLHELEYVIEAREVTPSTVCTTDKVCSSLENGVIIYKSEKMVLQFRNEFLFAYLDDFVSILRKKLVAKSFDATWFAPSFLAKDGTSAGYYEDCARFVKFGVTESNQVHPYSSRIQISEPGLICKILKGVILTTTPTILWNSVPLLHSADINFTSPDLDLHAYTPDGKHVGMNYTSGEYEIHIPGAVTSGDLIGGEEWIFVPTGTQVTYSVDSHNVKKFLEENPDVNPANATMNYSTISMEYGENPQRVQLSDGNWTVTNRTVSIPKEDKIEPGTTKTIQIDTIPKDTVQLSTEKTSYYQGESINIRLKNYYSYPVHIITGSNSCDKFRIYNVDNNSYVDLIGKSVCAAVILEEDVPSGGTIERTWNQKDGYGNQVPNGKYRAEIANYSSDIFTITSVSTIPPTPIPTTTKGDVNGDGQVTIVDALFLAQYTVSVRTLSSSQLAAADVNCNNVTDIVDALLIAQYTAGIRTTPYTCN